MINIQCFTFNALQENTYLLWDETKECCIIDPGCYTKQEEQELIDFIKKNDLKVKLLLNTHCHVDHVLGNAFVKRHYNVELGIHKSDENTLKSVEVYASHYGFNHYQPSTANYFIEAGQKILIGAFELEVLFVPGHAPGHIAFLNKIEHFCIAGDVLFYRSIGRYDLPGGNYNTLINSIKTQLYSLDNNIIIYPGHGPSTTIGDEKKYNPFVQGI